MAADVATFVQEQLPAARVASARLGIPVSVILAQWSNETGHGTSPAWQRNNYAGVTTLTSDESAVGGYYDPATSPIVSYPTEAAGLAGYIARWQEPIYGPTRAVWASTQDPIAIAQSIEASPWATGHYGGTGLEDLIRQNNLTQYDTGAPAGALPPSFSQPTTTGTSSTGTGSTGATLASASDPFPGGSWDPANWPFEAASGLAKNVGAIVLTGVFVVAGLGLVVAGFWRAAAPRVKDTAQTAAKAAAVAA